MELRKLIRLPAVCDATGFRPTKTYDLITKGLHPPPVRIDDSSSARARTVAWVADEIAAVNAARIAGRNDDEIRRLIKQLVESRQSADAQVRKQQLAVRGDRRVSRRAASAGRA